MCTELSEFMDDDIAAQALTFFLDGYETSSTALSVLMYDLACNPNVQKRLREEVDTVKEKHNGEVNFDVIQEMHYLDMVLQGKFTQVASFKTNHYFSTLTNHSGRMVLDDSNAGAVVAKEQYTSCMYIERDLTKLFTEETISVAASKSFTSFTYKTSVLCLILIETFLFLFIS